MNIWFPSIERHGWALISGEERHLQYPEFWIPERRVRETLAVGNLAKLQFEIETTGRDGFVRREIERMWVAVVERLDGVYRGLLDNQPVTAESDVLGLGSEVFFLPEHVIDTDRTSGGTWVQGGVRNVGRA